MRKSTEGGQGSLDIITSPEATNSTVVYEDLDLSICTFRRTPSADKPSLTSSMKSNLRHTYYESCSKDLSPPTRAQSFVIGHGPDGHRSQLERVTMTALRDSVGSSSKEEHTYAQMRDISLK